MSGAAFTTAEDGGILGPITLDGVEIEAPVASLTGSIAEIEETVHTADSGSVTFTPLAFAGLPDRIDKVTFELPVNNIKGPSRRHLERARARGGYHTFTVWKPISAFYTAAQGQDTFYLPSYRRNAAQVLGGQFFRGLALNVDSAPFRCWINDVLQVTNYASGPALDPPSSESIVVSAEPELTGPAKDYVPFRLGSPAAAGDVIETEWFVLYVVRIVSPRIHYPKSVQESHSYTLVER